MAKKQIIKPIKSRRAYTLKEIADLLGLNVKTCSRWIDKGLKPITPNNKPILIMGSEVINFIKQNRQKNKITLKENEYYCLKCRKAVKAQTDTERIIRTGQRIGKENREQKKKTGLCEYCNQRINKFI